MRVIVFFDLPVFTKADIRQYNKFRKFLIGQGFVKMQKSVYSKIAINGVNSSTHFDRVHSRSCRMPVPAARITFRCSLKAGPEKYSMRPNNRRTLC